MRKHILDEENICQNTQACLTLDVDINYQRNFNLGSVSVSAPTVDRTITIHKGNTIVYSKTQKGLKPNKGGIVGNTRNELAVFTQAGEDKANLDDERDYIDVISQVSVRDIVKLAQ